MAPTWYHGMEVVEGEVAMEVGKGTVLQDWSEYLSTDLDGSRSD
jgi:hypothetical protein